MYYQASGDVRFGIDPERSEGWQKSKKFQRTGSALTQVRVLEAGKW
jgi:hypothetical protein